MEGFFVHVANKYDSYRQNKPGPGYQAVKRHELRDIGFYRAVFAEFLATLLFVFLGCAAASYKNGGDDAAVATRVSFSFGLAIMVLIQMFGHISGGHINPAVSLGFAVTRTITPIRAIAYILAQCLGAIVGGYILMGVTPDKIHGNLGVTAVSSDITAWQGFGIEIIHSFVLVASIFGTTDPNRTDFGSPSLAIGLTVSLCHFSSMMYTGASMNPARSLGSAVVSNSWKDHWVYWAGPLIGGVIAALMYKYILNPYRGWSSPDEAMSKMLTDGGMVVVPKDYIQNPGSKKQLSISEHI